RTRQERSRFEAGQTQPSPMFERIMILDPIAGVQYILDPHSRIAYRFPFKRVVPNGTSQPPPPPPPNPKRPQISKQPLGSQVMEGVSVEGERTMIVYPVGFMGNDHPINRTCDDWQSPDLKITLLNTCTDPRSGETESRATNINRSEPDPSLFQVPEGYSIVDGRGQTTMKFQLPPQ
ncbi:MAG: hypothetical protein ACRD37_13525, partial [Candidatus Acidiferrales bacterium]